MGAGTAIPSEEYLAHCYEPDCEYVDGQIVERDGGDFFHSLLQGALVTHLNLLQYRAGKQSYYVLPECRAKVRGGDDSRRRYRIPDISVMPIRSAPASIILEPPLVVIEILSPEDRFHAVVQKCADYEAFGIPEIWIVNPHSQEVWTVRDGQAHAAADRRASFRCEGGEVLVDFNEVFAASRLNERRV